jgi:hypothetical protein
MKRVVGILTVIALALVLTSGCNPLGKVGEKAIIENRKNVEYMQKNLDRYIDADARLQPADKEDRKKATQGAVDLARKMEAQFKK